MESPEGRDGGRPTAEEVISKLKDDGDFDALRLKIVRKLKENEDLRNQIIAEVKESVALNRDGAENMKPRQLSDAIHEEIGKKVMGQISDEIWKIIRSSDGMKDEITESVKSVYNKLVNPPKEEINTFSLPRNQANAGETLSQAATSSCEITTPCEDEPLEPPGFAPCVQASQAATSCETAMQPENEPLEPPGFAPSAPVQVDDGSKEEHVEVPKGELPLNHHKEVQHGSPAPSPTNDDGPPGFAHFQTTDPIASTADDEDPDVPPGFG
ncbi:hypothetical protein Taro_023452 [Colocasia esculenta]|uniref:BOD1/SHG1 domain-containing protein n=1 Tax=Colocasia esculenta TaxID=4460 RepID=A0A843VAU8_COLES|nr:hypothetical protein [Colocasia esculenta]